MNADYRYTVHTVRACGLESFIGALHVYVDGKRVRTVWTTQAFSHEGAVSQLKAQARRLQRTVR